MREFGDILATNQVLSTIATAVYNAAQVAEDTAETAGVVAMMGVVAVTLLANEAVYRAASVADGAAGAAVGVGVGGVTGVVANLRGPQPMAVLAGGIVGTVMGSVIGAQLGVSGMIEVGAGASMYDVINTPFRPLVTIVGSVIGAASLREFATQAAIPLGAAAYAAASTAANTIVQNQIPLAAVAAAVGITYGYMNYAQQMQLRENTAVTRLATQNPLNQEIIRAQETNQQEFNRIIGPEATAVLQQAVSEVGSELKGGDVRISTLQQAHEKFQAVMGVLAYKCYNNWQNNLQRENNQPALAR